MKRARAIRYAHTIAARIRARNGIWGTPECEHEFVRIKRVWIFGSTAKGSETPNDLDVLIEYQVTGRFQLTSHWRGTRKGQWVDRLNARAVPRSQRQWGIPEPLNSARQCFRAIRKGMPMVRIHQFEIDGDLAQPRVLIYPRNDLAEQP